MYTQMYTILRSSPKSQTSFKRYVGPKKVQIWTKKGPKWAGLDFYQTVNINFPKEDRKISFYAKNQQNSMNDLQDISRYVDFGPKRSKRIF